MVRIALILLLALSASLAQTAPANPASQPQLQSRPPASQAPGQAPATGQAADTTASALPANTAVITLQGACHNPGLGQPQGPPKSSNCVTVITKSQFEGLLDALNSANQPLPPNVRRNLAQAYVELSAYAEAAAKAGTENDARFQEVMQLVRMRTLADMYRRSLEEKYRNPPEADLQAYYQKNISKFEEIKLSRIFIPAKNPAAQNNDWEKQAAQVANDMHDRAAKGEELEKLQKEAYTTLGLTISPPNTIVGARRRGMLPAAQETELFAMKAGEVSKLQQETAGYLIYKVESHETLPFEKVKDEISREVFRQNLEKQLDSVVCGIPGGSSKYGSCPAEAVHAELNEQYFGPAPAPPTGAPSGRGPATPGPANPPSANGVRPATPPKAQTPPK